jgi:hypothetical protein
VRSTDTLEHELLGSINIGIYTGFIFMWIETATSAEWLAADLNNRRWIFCGSRNLQAFFRQIYSVQQLCGLIGAVA